MAGPVLAGVVATAATWAVLLSVDPVVESSGCQDDAGFACLGVGLVVLVTFPVIATLVVGLVLVRSGVPRAGTATLLALATAVTLASAGVLPATAYVLLPGLATAAWVWALRPGRGVLPPAGLAVAVTLLGVVSLLVTQAQGRQDTRDRYAAVDAPLLLLADDDWTLVAADPTGTAFGTLYDGPGGADPPPRLAVTVADRPADFDPVADCATATGLVADTPGDTCRAVSADLWTVQTGLAITHLARSGDAVVGLELLYPGQLTDGQAEALVGLLQPVTVEEILAALPD